MMKRGKKILSVFQIQLLIVSIFAFCFILNMSFVSANGEPPASPEAGAAAAGSAGTGGLSDIGTARLEGLPSSTYAPAHGNFGAAYEKIFGVGSTAPKGSSVIDSTTGGVISTSSGWGYSVSGILRGAWWGAMAAGVVKMLGGFFGVNEGVTNAAASAVGWGVFAGKAVATLWGEGGTFATSTSFLSAGAVFGIGLAVAVIAFIALYKDIEIEVVEVECNPWDSATGGSYCERCNDDTLPCSEYQCRSLGQGCQLINPGTKDAKCVWVQKNDVEFPTIQPWDEALLDGYRYTPDNAISPPDRGVVIEKTSSSDKCVYAFTPLSFGITLDEPGRCKIDYLRRDNFDEMNFYFGGSSLFKYNHTQVLSLPGPNSVENLTLENDGNFEVYTRCQDANGNTNTATFVFKFCVSDGPDTTAPLIVSTKILNNAPIAAGQTELEQEIYVNEPSECRWDHLDRDYKDMENQMECSTRVYEMNAQMLYTCKTTLNGIKDNSNNKFYFRCKDQPTKAEDERNTNTESYEYTIIGTRPLVISDVGPNDETIRDSTGAVKVTLEAETSAGYDDGKATCYFSETDQNEDYVAFLYEDGPFAEYSHSQDLWLPEGSYQYYIKCIDLGGNADTQIINFNVETDTSAPLVVRAFHDGSSLKIITDEDATCVYDTKNCLYDFEDGLAMTSNDNEHSTGWNTNIDFYIKCQDEYGKEPDPNVCSIIVRPSEI